MPPMKTDLHVRVVGAGSPVLVLLHGLGVNGDVWDPFLAHLAGWPGRIVIPDMRGHGRSSHANAYSDAAHAADVAALVRDEQDIYVIGHSMGGMIALVLTGGHHVVNVRGVFAFGLKVGWTESELARLAEFAQKPARRFATREEASARFLRTTGLEGFVGPGAPVVEAGIVREDQGYRLAADPRTVLVAGASAAAAWRASTAPRRLACGSRDALVTLDETRTLDPDAIALGDAGHNVHVEAPGTLFDAVPFLRDG
jgi:pimeloyl-ACP methyl ester carboxylesterase